MDWTLKTVYVGCAAVGGLILLLQLVLLFFGADVDADADLDADLSAGDGLSLLSIRSLAGFLTFFGLCGWWGINRGYSTSVSLGLAALAGGIMMLGVAWMMSLQSKLSSDGSFEPSRAVGQSARVYLRVPAEQSGNGKVTVSVEGRSVELSAVTLGPELPTGSNVRIVRLVTHDVVEVAPL